ncbi:MAG: FkbM family methyltransferase [Bacteroidales bacterium]|jgi:FkbM family methyltransferase|nr:FkbM family methyltransferase [Bacteroidales bacterium]
MKIKEKIKNFLPANLLSIWRFLMSCKRKANRFVNFGIMPFYKFISVDGVSFLIKLHPYKNCCVDDVIARTGVWESDIVANIRNNLKPNSVFIDIGANIGYHTLFAASLYNRSVNVYAFEPIKRLYLSVKDSISKNSFKNIVLENYALSNIEGFATINIPKENAGGSSLISGLSHHVGVLDKEVIKLCKLDSYIQKFDRVDLIKIDVEGLEFEVLDGGRELISKFKPKILMEFSPCLYKHNESDSTQKIIEFLREYGYVTYLLDGSRVDLNVWVNTYKGEMPQVDVLCV